MLSHIEAGAVVSRNKGSPHQARPGFHWECNFELSVRSRIHSSIRTHAAVNPGMDSVAIDTQFELFIGNVCTYT